jgi:hypothetical protein
LTKNNDIYFFIYTFVTDTSLVNLTYLIRLFFFCFFMTLYAIVSGQTKVWICYVDDDTKVDTIRTTVDSIQMTSDIKKHLQSIQKSGYLYCQIDTTYCHVDTCISRIYKGSKYSIQSLTWSDELTPILAQSGIKNHLIKGRSIDSIQFNALLLAVVDHYSRHGYPYALAKIDSVSWINNKLHGRLNFDKGLLIELDSFILESRLRIQRDFLPKLLNLKQGDFYDYAKIDAIPSRLSQLPYMKLTQQPLVRFVNQKANIYLKIEPVPSSRFDLLIGVLPKIVNGSRKWNITGDVLAELNNSLGYGEYLYAQYKGLKPDNAEVLLKATVPYIGRSRVGGHMDFRFYRNATDHVDLYFDGGGQYILNGTNNLRILYNYRSSRLVQPDTIAIVASKRLPPQLDVVYTGGGVSLEVRKLDYRFNPTRGYNLLGQSSIGRRKVLENYTISRLEGFEQSYDTLKASSLQAELYFLSALYIPIKDWATVKLGNTSGLKYNKDGVRTNEYMRIGGNRTLRGFAEEVILTDMYSYVTVEFRFVFDKNSYLSLPFIDYGVTRIIQDGKHILDRVYGVGLGLNFATKAGIFNVSFATGSNLGNPLDFSKLKVHFGYVSQF